MKRYSGEVNCHIQAEVTFCSEIVMYVAYTKLIRTLLCVEQAAATVPLRTLEFAFRSYQNEKTGGHIIMKVVTVSIYPLVA